MLAHPGHGLSLGHFHPSDAGLFMIIAAVFMLLILIASKEDT